MIVLSPCVSELNVSNFFSNLGNLFLLLFSGKHVNLGAGPSFRIILLIENFANICKFFEAYCTLKIFLIMTIEISYSMLFYPIIKTFQHEIRSILVESMCSQNVTTGVSDLSKIKNILLWAMSQTHLGVHATMQAILSTSSCRCTVGKPPPLLIIMD